MNVPVSYKGSSFLSQESANNFNELSYLRSMLLRTAAISNELKDDQGNLCRLWALPNSTFFGTVCHTDGNVSIIPSSKIDIPSSSDTLHTLNRLKNERNLFLDIVYISEQQRLVIFPHLRAAGKDDQIAPEQKRFVSLQSPSAVDHKIVEVSRDPLYPKPEWVVPDFPENPSMLGHIFSKSKGHFAEDTPDNRRKIREAVSDPRNKVGTKNSGTEIYYKISSDGYYKVWAHVENGVIRNGGTDTVWARWQPMQDNIAGGKTAYAKLHNDLSLLKEQVQIGRLTNVYNTTIKCNQWEPHPSESRSAGRDVGGVRHQVGLILDVLEELKSSRHDDHVFYIPTTEESPLEKDEVIVIARDIARGIYLHDAVPFFSLNMNPHCQNYSIIHPAYQNTYVGYVISMLDYYLKGFWTGQLFREDFIKQWSNTCTTDKKILQDNSISINELSKQSGASNKKYFRSFNQILDDLIKEASFTKEQFVDRGKIPENLILSCRIIGKQNRVQKYENCFVLDGEIELVCDVEWTPEGRDEVRYNILDNACKILCEDIQLIGFRIPEMQKWLSALKLMNFFSCYFRTLQEAEKIPCFSIFIPENEEKVCPCIFPPIPYPKRPCIEIEASVLLLSLSQNEKERLLEYCQQDSEASAKFQNIKFCLIDRIKNLPIEEIHRLSQEDIESLTDAILISFRSRYLSFKEDIEKFLIEMKIPVYRCHSALTRIDKTKAVAQRLQMECKSKIASKKMYEDEDYTILENYKSIEEALEESIQWLKDPLCVITENHTFSYDIEQRLASVQKTSSEQNTKVFGGYELSLHDVVSEESSMGRKILEYIKKSSIELDYEKVTYLSPKQIDPPGLFFTLPIEDSFPLSTHGIPYDVIKILPSTISNNSDEVFYSLLHAIREEDEETFSKFRAKDVDCNRLDVFGRGVLHYAAVASTSRFLQILVEQNADLAFPDSSGWTALHHAAYTGRLASVELLVVNENLINRKAFKGETAVYVAVNNNQIPVVEKLIAVGADLNIKSSHGFNVLMSAIHNGHEDMAELLIHTGKIDTNYTWHYGKSVLHFAIEMQMEKVLKALLKQGLDRNLVYLGKRPTQLAQEEKWEKGVEILRTNFAYQAPWFTSPFPYGPFSEQSERWCAIS